MSCPWRIYKFGGTSLGTPGRLPAVLDLIEAGWAEGGALAVVVSALGDTTDWLVAAARAAERGDTSAVRAELARVRELAGRIAAPVLTAEARTEFTADVERILTPVERVLAGIELTRECSPRLLDTVLAAGEPISVALVARALSARGRAPALAVDARTFLVADAPAGLAAVDQAASAARFAPVAAAWTGRLPVVTGFLASTPAGQTVTLGRNGSDYTATLLAALLRAESVTIWTDVLGVMTADPAIVSEAVPVERLAYDEALELAYFGTRMFHPRTIIPLRACGAAMHIRSTTIPAAPGTRIDAVGNPDPNRPTCVTSLERLALLGVFSRRADLGRPVAGRIVAALDAAGVRVWLTTESTPGQTFSVVVPEAEAARAQSLIEAALAAERQRGDLLLGEPRSPVTLVTLVAEAMGQKPNVAGRFLGAIGRTGVAVRAIAQGASQRSISCVVDAEDTARAVRTVHAAFNLSHAEISVCLVGKGLVGRSLLAQLAAHGAALHAHHDVHVRLVGLADRTGAVFEANGLASDAVLGRLRASPTAPSAAALLPALARLPNPVLVDCTAADGMEELYAAAFAGGINVVSANKKPLALPAAACGALHAAARRHYRAWHYETTVGAALPVIETLKNLVRTGDTIVRIEGAFSGTLGFLCEQLAAGEKLSVAVRRARDLGYTEPHPRDDLSGLDVARKALILARELGLSLELADVALEPFVPAAHLAEDDPEKFLGALASVDDAMAARLRALVPAGGRPRYLARIEPGGRPVVSVGLVAVDAAHPAAALRGAEAFVAFHTERYRDYPLIVRGAGAGGDVTAAGVLADILRLAQNIRGRV